MARSTLVASEAPGIPKPEACVPLAQICTGGLCFDHGRPVGPSGWPDADQSDRNVQESKPSDISSPMVAWCEARFVESGVPLRGGSGVPTALFPASPGGDCGRGKRHRCPITRTMAPKRGSEASPRGGAAAKTPKTPALATLKDGAGNQGWVLATQSIGSRKAGY
eukprot:gene13834-biopygen12997